MSTLWWEIHGYIVTRYVTGTDKFIESGLLAVEPFELVNRIGDAM